MTQPDIVTAVAISTVSTVGTILAVGWRLAVRIGTADEHARNVDDVLDRHQDLLDFIILGRYPEPDRELPRQTRRRSA